MRGTMRDAGVVRGGRTKCSDVVAAVGARRASAPGRWIPQRDWRVLAALVVGLGLLGVAEVQAQATVVARVEAALAQMEKPRLHVSVDKPLYRPGESVWFRVWAVSGSLEKMAGDEMTVYLVDPRGSNVAEKALLLDDGVAANDFELPVGMAGGIYTLRANLSGGQVVERSVVVSVYEPPRVKKTLDFLRKAYGPGDVVRATVKLERATGEALAQHAFTALVLLDGRDFHRAILRTNAKGEAVVSFELPEQLGTGDGLLTILVDDAGVTESIQKRIPITLERIKLGVFPEGGDLVEGLASRVYFSARDLFDKPVDVEVEVRDGAGRVITTAASFHDGMGRFSLRPEAGESYHLVVTRPTSIKQQITLPTAQPAGCVMQTVDDFGEKGGALEVVVECTEASRDVVLVAALRGQVVASAEAQVGRKARMIALQPETEQGGALRLSLFDAQAMPLAERVVYFGPRRGAEVIITSDKPSYSPRELVTLTVQVKDHAGKGIVGDVALAVVDDTILNFADDKSGNLLVSLLLAAELPPGLPIEEPNFYFSDDEKAVQALDYLLGTAGWRRFSWEWVQR